MMDIENQEEGFIIENIDIKVGRDTISRTGPNVNNKKVTETFDTENLKPVGAFKK